MTTTTMTEEVIVPREAAALHVLIVDDEPTIREACVKVAQMTGMHQRRRSRPQKRPSISSRIQRSTSCSPT